MARTSLGFTQTHGRTHRKTIPKADLRFSKPRNQLYIADAYKTLDNMFSATSLTQYGEMWLLFTSDITSEGCDISETLDES